MRRFLNICFAISILYTSSYLLIPGGHSLKLKNYSRRSKFSDIARRFLRTKRWTPIIPSDSQHLRYKRQEDSDGPSEPPALCTFGSSDDLELCSWRNPKNTSLKLKWRAGHGMTAFWLGGPKVDHTEGDRSGGYAFFETSYERPIVDEIEPKSNRNHYNPSASSNFQSSGQTTSHVVASALKSGPSRGRPLTSAALTSFNSLSTGKSKVSGLAADGETALLRSSNVSQTGPEGLCLSFFYSLEGLSAGRLRVLLMDIELGENRSLWERGSDGLDGAWQHGEVAYTYGSLHKILFEAVPKISTDPARAFRGYVALDDIQFERMGSEKACLGHCTFEGHFCAWKNVDDEDDFDWDSGRGSQSFLTGPSRDYSSFGKDEPTGGYAFIDSAYPRRPGDKARLVSPEFLATGDNNPMCMRFATHMFGNGIGTLRVIQKALEANDSEGRTIWEITGEAGNNWYTAQVPVSSPTPFTLTFEAIVGSNTLGNIAIDNVSFQPGTCPISPQTASRNSGNCNFEEDTCGWTNPSPQEGSVEVDWARQYSFNINGPTGDHSRGSREGYYMNLLSNSQSPLRGGTRAWLVSPRFPPGKTPRCLAFYYYMYERTIDPAGPSLGSLRVYVRSVARDSSPMMTLIWRVNNHQGQRWLPARGPIVLGPERATPTEPYQVIVEGIWGDGRVGFIAIDDISFFNGDCTTQPSKATTITGECSFEQDMCGWKNGTLTSSTVKSPSGPSVIGSGGAGSRNGRPYNAQVPVTESLTWRMATPTSRPANLQDHTFRAPTGYAFFDIFNQASAQNPVLRSPPFEPSQEGTRCLSFWFAPFGRGESTTLRVVRTEGGEGAPPTEDGVKIRDIIWQLSTRRFDIGRPDWIYGQVSIRTETPHQIEFEGESTDGGFALDDLTFYEGMCKIRPDQATAPANLDS